MNITQLGALHHFIPLENTLDGKQVEWDGYHYETMAWMDILRQQLKFSITLIRGGAEHGPTKLTCVDAVSSAPFTSLVMSLMRLPAVSWGVYEGGSFHLDLREYDPLPARWMAFRDNEWREQDLFRRGWGQLISGKKDGWIYLSWNHESSFMALDLLVKMNTAPQSQPIVEV